MNTSEVDPATFHTIDHVGAENRRKPSSRSRKERTKKTSSRGRGNNFARLRGVHTAFAKEAVPATDHMNATYTLDIHVYFSLVTQGPS